MKWITEIKLNNYRAFGKPETIKIPKDNHLLIYGENGSGKSSIYNGLKDFFSSSVANSKTKFKLNKFEEIAGNLLGDVTVKISEVGNSNPPIKLKFIAPPIVSTNDQPEIILANKFKGFLDYKRMLKIHSLNIPDGEQPNIFDLVIKELLNEHRIADPKGGTTTVELLDEYNRIAEIMLNNNSNWNNFKIASTELGNLEISVIKLLRNVFINANSFLEKYFKNKLSIDLIVGKMSVIKPAPFQKKKMVEELSLKIKYAGSEIESYQSFLNEARLSSLAICIYLASIKTFEPEADTLKVLYLDDVFIGLDTNNRIPLLNILKKEFIDSHFQVFISTYDRQWFVTAQHWFKNENCNFKLIELFVNDADGNPTTPDYPVVIDPSENNFEKAKSHFNFNDFPAAANYLRKSCESELKRILPRHQTLRVNHNTDEVEKITVLETLIDNFVIFMSKNNLNQIPFQHFKTYKKILFNPLSHDDLEAPHYRNEIRDGINLVIELQKIKTKEIVSAKESVLKPMKLGIRDPRTKEIHKYKITVLENLQIIQQNGSPIQLSIIKCEVNYGSTRRQFQSLHAAFDQIRIDRGYSASTDYTDFYNDINISTHRKFNVLLTF